MHIQQDQLCRKFLSDFTERTVFLTMHENAAVANKEAHYERLLETEVSQLTVRPRGTVYLHALLLR
jgi:hypothetical protein